MAAQKLAKSLSNGAGLFASRLLIQICLESTFRWTWTSKWRPSYWAPASSSWVESHITYSVRRLIYQLIPFDICRILCSSKNPGTRNTIILACSKVRMYLFDAIGSNKCVIPLLVTPKLLFDYSSWKPPSNSAWPTDNLTRHFLIWFTSCKVPWAWERHRVPSL